ncbi:claspin isoform X2 [Schistocerca cancellata]|uniref:claspin isoform X2 n=1 Tax=Schistocerca cancellata TaxID=274614 RepID=UPI0021182AC8|nr:claspin isoform X2 [Schistocerca cancellata]
MVDVMTMKNHWTDDELVKIKRKSKRLLFDSDEETESVDNEPQSFTSGNDEISHSNVNADCDDDHGNKTDFTELSTPDLQQCTVRESSVSTQKSLFQNKDLYDAESTDDDNSDDGENKEGDSTYIRDSPAVGSSNNEDEKEIFPTTTSTDIEHSSSQKLKKPMKPTRQPASRKAKTAAKSEIDNIHSETQRLLRQSRLSLPYHRPKQHSIKEFLQRRKPIVPAVKEISEATKNLGLIWKDLEEREKEAEVFYKSESEDSDSDTSNKVLDEQPKLSDLSNTGENFSDKGVSMSSQIANDVTSSNILVTQTGQVDDENTDQSDTNCSVKQNGLECDQMPTSAEKSSATYDTDSAQSHEISKDHTDVRSTDKKSNIVSNPNITSDSKCTLHNKEGSEVTKKAVGCGMICDDNACDSTVDDHTVSYSENVSMLDVFNIGSQDLVLHYTVSDTVDLCQDKDVMSEMLGPPLNLSDVTAEPETKTETKLSATEIQKSSDNSSVSTSGTPKSDTEGILPNSSHESRKVCPDLEASIAEGSVSNTSSDNCANASESVKELGGARTSEIETNGLTSVTNLRKRDNDRFKSTINIEVAKTEIVDSIKSNNDVADNCGSKDASHEAVRACTSNKSKNVKFQSRINTFFKPQLKGDPDEIIDLDACVTKTPSGVNALIERFIKHSAAKKKPVDKKNLEVSVEKSENGEENVVKEVLTVPLDEEAPEDPELAKPGAKLLRLKEELQQKMARQREEEWLKKQQEFKMDNEEDIDDEKSDCGMFDEDDDAEEPLTESESEEEEEEEETTKVVRKKTVKNKFLDDEAEVSGDDEDYEEDEDDDGGGDDSDANQEEEEEEDNDDDGDNNSTEDSELRKKNCDEEPDKMEVTDENATEVDGNLQKGKKLTRLKRIMTHDMFDSQGSNSEDEGDDANTSTVSNLTIPPYQPGGAQSQISQLTQEKVNAPSPTLEVMLSKESVSQQLLEGSDITTCAASSIFGIPHVAPSQEGCKKLFLAGTFDTQKNMDELMEFCSGDFPMTDRTNSENLNELKQPDIEKDLLDLCSGKFPTQPISMRSLEKDEESRNDAAAFDDTQSIENTQELRSTLSSDKSFSLKNTASSKLSQGDVSVKAKQFPKQIVSSDEEDSLSDDTATTKRKKRNKKLDFSDEEEEEENVLSDRETDNEEMGETDNPQDIVDYDSEENEVAENPKRVPRTLAAKEFFENEAELSESEWDSEDEDERDLDNLEWEEGDDENVDQKKLKEQLGKIHMRQVLDDDQRNVRLLQELLLEDGELHSEGGRERKFRWKNMNVADENEQSKKDSDAEDAVEFEGNEEDEAEWRKERFERETFLMEQKEKAAAAGKDDIEFIEDDSQLLKLGKAALERMRRSLSQDMSESQSVPRRCSDNLEVSPNPKQPFQLLTKRGSFLARSESSLARIAQLTDGTSRTSTVITTKNSRNFVFATLSPEKAEQKEEVTVTQKVQKRKSNGATPFLVKKLKMSEGKDRNSAKCLFDHLEH